MLLLLAGCGQFAPLNAPPEVNLESPETGAAVAYSAPNVFVAKVVDDADPLDDLRLTWLTADGAEIAGSWLLSPEDDLATFTAAPRALPKGNPTLTLRAFDRLGESGRAILQLSVADNLPPEIEFESPVDGGRYAAGEPMVVRVRVTDPDPQLDSSLTLRWSGSAVAGGSDAPDSLAESGLVTFTFDALSLTHWTLGLEVEDALGASSSTEVEFDIVNGDVDADGAVDVALGGTDCNDASSAVRPGATERCNGYDDDCDGATDDEDDPADPDTFFADADGDGYGSTTNTVEACAAPDGYVEDSTDCDDDAGEVNPGATEVCNGVDDDCAGGVDVAASDAISVYADADGDGYGAGAAISACEVTEGYAASDSDCNDADENVSPGRLERCDPADVDEDCNGVADDAGAEGESAWYADADGDGHGSPDLMVEGCSAPAGYVAAADDCNDAEPEAYDAAAEVCEDGVDNDCSGGDGACLLSGALSASGADLSLTGAGTAYAASALDGLPDHDGDGFGAIVVGAWGEGRAYVAAGAGLSSGALSRFDWLEGAQPDDFFGWSVAGAGDLDADGVGEFVVAAVDAEGGMGAVYLFSEGDSGSAASVSAASVEGTVGALGSSLDAGEDHDGDGATDVLAGERGQAVLFDAASLSTLGTWVMPGALESLAVAFTPDLDGDGLADAVVGVEADDVAVVVLGGLVGDLDLSTDGDLELIGTAGEGAGASVAGVGDTNGDGYGELLVGAPNAGTAGAAYLVDGNLSVALALSSAGGRFTGLSAGDAAGYRVAGPGDVDGDGLHDLLIGAYGSDLGGSGSGAAALFYGTSAGFGAVSFGAANATLAGAASSDALSECLATMGDLGGDGFPDLLVGAPNHSGGAGALYLYSGGNL